MKKTLAIDIGNTNIAAGVFAGRRLLAKTRIPTAKRGLYHGRLRRIMNVYGINAGDIIIIASVVPASLGRIVKVLKRIGRRRIHIAGRNIPVPVRNLYKVKSEVGQDRLVNAFAAGKLYGKPAVVIDFGTAVTFDVISRQGAYLGGLILPGIDISFESLYRKTALLPKVGLKKTGSVIGRTTVDSMRGGILFGLGAACDGLVARYRKILGKDIKVIATGGNAGLIRKYTKSIQIIDPDLTLKGLMLLA